jgi:hypothetical protein
MHKKMTFVLSALILMGFFSTAWAEDEKNSEIKGYFVPEYYFVVSHHTAGAEEDDIEGQHGLWFRRLYFEFDQKLSEKFSVRVRFEADSAAYAESTMVPFVKDLFLKTKLGGDNELMIGMFGPPTFEGIEKIWGYRYLEKTVLDLFKLASSRDIGIALSGGKNFFYTIMYGNFGSNKGEDNAGKGFYGQVGYQTKTFYTEANGYYSNDGGKDYMLLQGFAAIMNGWGNVGLNYAYKNQMPNEGENKHTSVISAFGTLKLSDKINLVLRYDHFMDPNLSSVGDYLPIACDIAPARLGIIALDYKVHKNVKITPNVKFVFYGDPIAGQEKPGSDFYINLTGYIGFGTKF